MFAYKPQNDENQQLKRKTNQTETGLTPKELQ